MHTEATTVSDKGARVTDWCRCAGGGQNDRPQVVRQRHCPSPARTEHSLPTWTWTQSSLAHSTSCVWGWFSLHFSTCT